MKAKRERERERERERVVSLPASRCGYLSTGGSEED